MPVGKSHPLAGGLKRALLWYCCLRTCYQYGDKNQSLLVGLWSQSGRRMQQMAYQRPKFAGFDRLVQTQQAFGLE